MSANPQLQEKQKEMMDRVQERVRRGENSFMALFREMRETAAREQAERQ